MPKLLVVDDDNLILQVMRTAFQGGEITLETAGTAHEALMKFDQFQPDVVLLDVDLPDLSGIEAFRRIHQLNAKVPTIFLTGGSSTETAIEAMALGAYEYLQKPIDLLSLRDLLARAFEVSRLMHVAPTMPEETTGTPSLESLVGLCPAMQEVYKSIGRVAPQDVTVLILGESGTGKELVARAVYHHSRRAAAPFQVINCAAIPEALLESELFGHEKGAFTGATQKRIGKFEQCSGGTLFLDEVGDMTPLTQAKVLRVLQQQCFERVGSNETVQADVRVIAATNRDLSALAAAGRFRQDLFYRLNVYTISLPALRDRGDDLTLLMDHFRKHFNRQLGKKVRTFSPECSQLLRGYAWPGNVRELQSVLKHALLQATGPVLLPAHLPDQLVQPQRLPCAESPGQVPSDKWDLFINQRLQAETHSLYSEWLALTDHHLFTRVLRHCGGNLTHAAKILGIDRSTLRAKMRALGISTDACIFGQERRPQ